MNPKIVAVRSAVPKESWSNEKIEKLTGAKAEFVREKVGVHNRFFLSQEETGVDLSEEAVNKLFIDKIVSQADVELLVFVTQTPDHKIPQSSAILQNRLNLPTSCAAFDVSLGCSGFVYALSVVRSMMLVEGLNTAILVTCDPYSKIMDRNDKTVMSVFGDAATATLLSVGRTGLSIGKADMGTDGSFSDCLKINKSGGKYPLLGVHAGAPESSFSKEDVRLNMIGRDVFNFVVKNVPKSIDECLAKNSLELTEIDYFALHQGSKHMLDYMAGRVGIPDEKMLRNLRLYGNTVSSTVPMLLETLMLEKKLSKPNVKVLVSGFGVGLSWATNVLSS